MKWILVCVGLFCTGIALLYDYLIGGQSGFGSSQAVLASYGVISFVAAYTTHREQLIRARWLRSLAVGIAGVGLFLGLILHNLIDGHGIDFHWKKNAIVGLSIGVAVFGTLIRIEHFDHGVRLVGRLLMGVAIRRVGVNVALIMGTVIVCLTLSEILLHVIVKYDFRVVESGVWIPRKHKELDGAIDLQNYEIAKLNRHGFSDKNRSFSKPTGVRRIAVLGDSFIWGDGIPNNQIWSHILEKKITDQYSKVEVLSWGKNGWSTQDELRFLESTGVQYQIDLLLLGWVTNDPDLGDLKQQYLMWNHAAIWAPLAKIFPNTFDFAVSHINSILYHHVFPEYGYGPWEKKLYSSENLERYAIVLKKLRELCEKNRIKLLVVFTPNNHSNHFAKIYAKIIPILERFDMAYLNLLPRVREQVGHIPTDKLAASRADGHPGVVMTNLFANETFGYLKRSGLLE
ncbi:SGNH/GDSL hydrolase family protein [Gammaproteobacteria bacterium]|nr:SGNH/GDSL hydrolase family protein [Gammaproteobacteria bacterium]